MTRWRSAASPPTSIRTTTPSPRSVGAFSRRSRRCSCLVGTQVLLLAGELGVLQLGTVALDAAKIHANASRHSALSYGHAGQIEARLRAEVAELLAKAEAADGADLPDGLSIPAELARRGQRLAEIAKARATIAARARHAREQAEYDAKMAARAAKAAARSPEAGPPRRRPKGLARRIRPT
jgi:hypothetical protein